jgi:peroxiredoxin
MTKPKGTVRSRSSRRRGLASFWQWAGLIAVPLALAIVVAVSALSEIEPTAPDVAAPFLLAATNGDRYSLEDNLAEGDTLLYFSMGVGCDGCFAQIPELEAAMAERGINLLPIMVDPAPMVAAEAARFGIDRPILIDTGARVSAAYGMLGIYGHGDRPSHSFALVRQDGEIAWVRHYAEMFVPADALVSELDAALDT